MRRIAAEALGAIGVGTAISPLIDALQDPELEVRRSVAKALAIISDTVFWRVNVNDDLQTLDKLVKALQASDDFAIHGFLMLAMQRAQSPDVTAALVEQINISVEEVSSRYIAINILTTHQHHLQNLADSKELLKTLSDLALREEETDFIRYGAFLLLSSVNTPEALSLLNTHQSEFLELVEDNYTANLPFYLPAPLGKTSSPDPFRDEGTLVAFNVSPSSHSLPLDPSQPFRIDYFPQGAEPGDTREEVTARLDGKPAVCRFRWVADRWRRCQG